MNIIEIHNTIKNKFEKQICEKDKLLQKYKDIIPQIYGITCFTDIIFNDYIVNPLLQSIRDKEAHLFENVLFTAVPMAEINALAIKGDNNEFLVAINERFLSLIYSYNELSIMGIKNLKGGLSEKHFANNFLPIINSYLNPISGTELPIFSFSEISLFDIMFITERTIMCEQFIIAHELAHIYLSHHSSLNEDLNFVKSEFWDTYYAQNNYQEMEFDADIQAVKWLLDFSKSPYIHSPVQEKLLLFTEIFCILNLIECNTMFPNKNAKHPSAIARLNNIKDHFGTDVFSLGNYSIDDMLQNLKDTNSFEIEI